jgi:hypothetical protein
MKDGLLATNLDSYMVEPENFLLTFSEDTPKISPPLAGGDSPC